MNNSLYLGETSILQGCGARADDFKVTSHTASPPSLRAVSFMGPFKMGSNLPTLMC